MDKSLRIMNPNMMVTCPYNNAHRMKESRLQMHITKCRQDHLNDFHFQCPFNSTHVLPHQEKDYHLSRCPDRAPLDRKMTEAMDKNNPFKGRTAVPSYSEPIVVESSEIWDEDEDFEPKATGFSDKELPVGAIVQPTPFSKPASRRQLYQQLHQMPTDVEKKSTVEAPIVPPVPRQPKQSSEAARLQQNAGFQVVGLGRGKPASSRIAANIFNPAPESNSATAAQPSYSNAAAALPSYSNAAAAQRSYSNAAAAQPSYSNAAAAQPNSWGVGRGWTNSTASNGTIPRESRYSDAITAGINNLSLGRGRVQHSASVNEKGFSEDDFPELGLGRGASRNPQKQKW
ncbi:uncharacterized protein NPIL_181811 [Nephila pilipes]|uniref:CHHC U11-48K-type domain-containing protein n=1 Tax=Nephila pilipes TaxID=299642 RepID=A0A8X6U1E7_NEPPI|nr:uncharacterized protein NPIL_181811 [Nephila pilipes]